MRKLSLMLTAAIAAALVAVPVALAAPDATLTQVKTDVLAYFTDNIATVIGAFIGVALLLWFIGLVFRSVGVGRPRKVGG